MRSQVTRGLLHFVRTMCGNPAGKQVLTRLIGWFFTYMSFAIPAKRYRETASLLAFQHPQPAYPLHILLVPKRPISSFSTLMAADTALLGELVEMAQSLVQELDLESHGYRLIVNGGPNQDLPHLHFHLVSDYSPPES